MNEHNGISESGVARLNRRRYVRVDVSTAVSYACGGEEATKIGRSSNVGVGGIRLSTEEDLPLGTLLVLRFTLPESPREIVARGRIVLSYYDARTQHFVHGIAFTHVDPRDKEDIIHCVATEVRRHAPEGEFAD